MQKPIPVFKQVNIDEIQLLKDNPRDISEKDFKALCIDISNDPFFLIQRPPLLNKKGKKLICYAGTQRVKAARANGQKKISCWIEKDIPKQVQQERMLKDNLHRGEWNFEKLMEFDKDFLISAGFSLKDLQSNFGKLLDQATAKKKLEDTFIIPPFSVFDTRQGYWQERKSLWLSLGIKSHESREELKTSGSLSGSVPRYYDKKEQAEKTLGRKLSNEEFEQKYLQDFMDEGSQLKQTATGGLLSVFDPVLAEILYRWFCIKNADILDPFAGGSVRGIVASALNYKYTGIDLRKEQVQANKKNAAEVPCNAKNISWLTGDSLNINKLLPKSKHFDFIFSCPPYFDLEQYSEDPKDLSNLTWEDFRSSYFKIIKLSVERLHQNRFACFVVGDIRDQQGAYRNFVSETIKAFMDAGMMLYNEIILLNQLGSLPIRVGRQFQKSRKVGKAHQNVLVFYKGDITAIQREFPELTNIEKYLQEKNYEPNITLSTTH